MNRLFIIAGGIAVAVLAGGVWWMSQPGGGARPVVSTAMHGSGAAAPAPDADSIVIPDLTPVAMNGKQAFEANCASCHGVNAIGTDNGPPLVHKIYEPGHHADMAFHRAVQFGVQSHHWRYGDMPPVEGVNQNQLAWIIKYVREMQRANGIN